MGYQGLIWLAAVSTLLMAQGKFVKIENLHPMEGAHKAWNSDTLANWTNPSRSYRNDNGKAKLLQSVNEVTLDEGDTANADGATRKEWKSFYYPHHYQGSTGIPLAWSNGVINNNNLLTVGGGFAPVGTTATNVAGDLALKTTSTVQCLLFGVMGLVTFLLNSVMGLLISLKLPGLDGVLGTLLGGLGLGGLGLGGLGALNKQDMVAVDTKGKQMEYVHFPEQNHQGNGNSGGTHGSPDNLEYFEKN